MLAHDRGYGHLADSVRRERDAAWWEIARSQGYAKRKREAADLVHVRRGDNRSVDDCLVKIWGLHWRDKLVEHCQTYPWAVGRRLFVEQACVALKLPLPPPFYSNQTTDGENIPATGDQPSGSQGPSSDLPPSLSRDMLFYTHSSRRVQLEFVVDNQTVAGFANATVAIASAKYGDVVNYIGLCFHSLFRLWFDYKAERLDPVDWRAREWNTGADALVKHAIQTKSSGGTLAPELIRDGIAGAIAVQFFSDGGFVPGVGGAYGVQLVGHMGDEQKPERYLIGQVHNYDPDATSAFEMEIRGLETAVKVLRAYCDAVV